MKKLLMILLAALLVVALTACGQTPTETTAPTATTEPTATTAPTPTPSEEPTLVPTAVPNDDKDESKDNENDDGISIAPIVPSEDEDEGNNTSEEEIDFPYINDVKEPSATPVIVPTTVPTVTPSEAPTSTPSPVPTIAPTVAPTKAPTVTPSPTPTKAPEKVEANGDVIAWSDEVIKLNTLGIEVPVLKEFNKHALSGEAHEYISWNGDVTDDESLDKLYDILDETRQAAVDKGVVHEITGQGFLMDNYAITWDYMQYSANSDLELKRSPSDGEYTLILNASLLYDEFDTRDLAPYNRDVLKVMLSVISSTPEEIFEYIYTGIYEDGSVLYGKKYVPVGDAGIRWDYEETYVKRGDNGEILPGYPGHYVFKIRPQ